MKKLFAMLLALAMVMGMSMTTLAATRDKAYITVDGVGETAVLSIAQVIEPGQTSTGWKFCEDIEGNFLQAFGLAEGEGLKFDVKIAYLTILSDIFISLLKDLPILLPSRPQISEQLFNFG